MPEVVFKRQLGGCCSVCNPAALADVEVTVVVAQSPIASHHRRVQLCQRCASAFAEAHATRGRAPTVELHPEVWEFSRGPRT